MKLANGFNRATLVKQPYKLPAGSPVLKFTSDLTCTMDEKPYPAEPAALAWFLAEAASS